MSKMSELAAEIAELRKCAETIIGIADSFTEMFSSNAEPAEVSNPTAEPVLKLEDVRAVLAEKSRNGFTAEVRALLEKHGAVKLSEIDPQKYKSLLADAEVLGNG